MEVCENLSWSPVAVASSHSALAAVIGGFVFAGIVMTLERGKPNKYQPRSLTLLIAAFFVLLLASFFFSVISGEQACDRAWTEMVISAGLLGIGTLGVFSGVAWLTLDSGPRHAQATTYIVALARWIAAIIPLYLLITTQYYLYDMYAPAAPPYWLSVIAWACPVGIVLAVPVLTIVQRGDRWRPGTRSIKIAASASVSYGIMSAVCFGVLGGRDADTAVPPPTWVVATAVIFALTLSALAIITHLLALPTKAAPPLDREPVPANGELPVPPFVPAARRSGEIPHSAADG